MISKTYKNVEVEAINAPKGSYAAGCPANNKRIPEECCWCERAQ